MCKYVCANCVSNKRNHQPLPLIHAYGQILSFACEPWRFRSVFHDAQAKSASFFLSLFEQYTLSTADFVTKTRDNDNSNFVKKKWCLRVLAVQMQLLKCDQNKTTGVKNETGQKQRPNQLSRCFTQKFMRSVRLVLFFQCSHTHTHTFSSNYFTRLSWFFSFCFAITRILGRPDQVFRIKHSGWSNKNE